MQLKISAREIAKLKPASAPFEVYDTETPGLLLRVQPTGAQTYYLRYTLPNGSRRRVKLGTVEHLTPTQARDLAKDKAADVRKGIDPQGERQTMRQVPTLGEFIDGDGARNWLALRRSGKGTQERLKACFQRLWKTPLDQITQGAVERWRAGRLADGRKPGTVNRDIAALKTALSKAVHWGMLETNPLARVKPLHEDKSGVIRFLTADEESRLLKALDARQERLRVERDSYNVWRRERGYPELPDLRRVAFADFLKPLVLLSLHTGLRRGECFSLEWPDVDLDRAMLTVRGEKAKSGKTRHVPLNTFIRDVLRQWREQTPDQGLIFPSPLTGGRLDNCNTSWEAVLTEAKIEGFRWHDMRHHFASKLVMAGVDLNTVRDLLGHGSITMTLRYAHLAPENRAAAVERLVVPEGRVVAFPKKRDGRA